MPTPIDELLITVEVEQGSKLEELHRMLKDFQSLGGKLEVDVDLSEITGVKDIVVTAHEKINDLTNILIPLVTKFPSLLESIQVLINDNFQSISKDIASLLEWRENLDKDVKSVINSISSVLKAIEFISQNMDKFKDNDFYKKIIQTLNELTKNIKTIIQEQVYDEIKIKLDAIRQQVDINLVTEIKNRIDEILKLNFPKNFRGYMQSQVVSKIVKKLEEIIKQGGITIEDVKKVVDDVFGGINTGDYRGGSNWYGLDESDMKKLVENAEKKIIDFLEIFARGQARVNKRILEDISKVKDAVDVLYMPTKIAALDAKEAVEKTRGTKDVKSMYDQILRLLNTIKTFVYTGEFKPSEETLKAMSDTLETIRLTLDGEVAKNRDMQYLKTSFKELEEWIRDKMVTKSDMWSIEGSILTMEETLTNALPKKVGGWRNIWGKTLEEELSAFKVRLDENLKEILGEEFNQFYETQAATQEVARMEDVIPKPLIIEPTKIEDVTPKPTIEDVTPTKIEDVIPKPTIEEVAKMEEDIPREIETTVNIPGFVEELQYINKMLNEISQMVVTDWIEELGVLTRQMLQILETFGEKLFEKIERMGGDYNTLLHNYLRQEIKIDRFTNLLGKKIQEERKEFADLRELLYNFDIPEKFEVLHEKIDNLAQILNVPGGWEEIIGSVDYIWDNVQNLLRVLKRNDKILQVLKEVPDLERMGPVAESLEALLKILATAKNVREALLMWRGLVSGARAGIRNISHVSQIVETKRVLELEKITRGTRAEDLSEAIEDQIIRPNMKVWAKIDKTTERIERKIEEVKSVEEQNMDKDSMNKAKLNE